MEKQITPSILNVNQEDRIEIIEKLIKKGIKWFHYDIMDGHFVPNQAITVEEVIKFNTQATKHLSDVHLMVFNPIEYARKIKDHVTCITVHYEAFNNEAEIIEFINEFSHTNWIGLAIKPQTTFSTVSHLIHYFDLLLIMAVEPGKGGQSFIEETYQKIEEFKNFIDSEKLPTIIQVDGGIKDFNSHKVFESGSTFNVVGTYIVDHIDEKDLIDKLI